MIAFGRTWAAELVGRKIRVNTLIPGPTETPGLAGLERRHVALVCIGFAFWIGPHAVHATQRHFFQGEERHVRCVVDGPATLPAQVDGLLIGQAVLNLVLNAAEAMEPVGAENQVLIVGFGRVGRLVGEMLTEHGPEVLTLP